MPQGRFAFGLDKKKRIPKGYEVESPLIPLFDDESVVAIGTEPFEDMETAERFRKVLKPSREDSRSKSPKKKRGRNTSSTLSSDPLLEDWISSPTEESPPSKDEEDGPNTDEKEEDESGLFSDAADVFF
ncbi:MAG: hypothetical protein ACFFG0_10690 [Candidatus Thorarchaeota archaeon]